MSFYINTLCAYMYPYIFLSLGNWFVCDFAHEAPEDYCKFTAPIDCSIHVRCTAHNFDRLFQRLAWHGSKVRYQWSPQGGSCYITIQPIQFTYIYIHTYTHIFAHMHLHIYIYIYIHIHVCIERERGSWGQYLLKPMAICFSCGSQFGRLAGEAGVRLQCRPQELDLWMVWGKETCLGNPGEASIVMGVPQNR